MLEYILNSQTSTKLNYIDIAIGFFYFLMPEREIIAVRPNFLPERGFVLCWPSNDHLHHHIALNLAIYLQD